VSQYEIGRLAPFAGFAVERECILHVIVVRQQFRRARGELCQSERRIDRASAIEQKLPEQVVILISRLGAAAAIGEPVPSIQLLEQLARVGIAGRLLGQRRRHAREKSCRDQDLLMYRLGAIEDFAGKIVEGRFVGFRFSRLRRGAAATDAL
jgi:hypothetical protein